MSEPDLILIPAGVVSLLKGSTALAALTPRDGGEEKVDDAGVSLSSIVDVNDGTIGELVAKGMNALGICVAVQLLAAKEDDSQTVTPFYGDVHVVCDIYEDVNLNRITPETIPAGTGTGIKAWKCAALIVDELKLRAVPGTSMSYDLITREPGIVDMTRPEDLAAGVKVLRVHFTTKAKAEGRGES